jgi:hypothetical protein
VAIPYDPAASPRRIPSAQDLADAVQDALGFYSWRGLTAPTVAALAIAAVDRARRPSGTSVGPGRSRRQLVRPVARDDERVRALVLHLEENQGWRAYTLREVARRLIAELCAAEERSLWFDLELAWLLEPPA